MFISDGQTATASDKSEELPFMVLAETTLEINMAHPGQLSAHHDIIAPATLFRSFFRAAVAVCCLLSRKQAR